jgi:hypothetical protein
MSVHCKYLAKDGLCAGKYSGYACIKSQCALVRESKQCEHHEPTGDYCRKYARFGCVGRDNCESLSDYLDTVSEDQAVSPGS